MRKPSLILGIGIAIGASIGSSVDALIIGVAIALVPWFVVGLLHAGTWANKTMWKEIAATKSLVEKSGIFRPSEMDGFEYQRYYDTGVMPIRWERYYAMMRRQDRVRKLENGGKVWK